MKKNSEKTFFYLWKRTKDTNYYEFVEILHENTLKNMFLHKDFTQRKNLYNKNSVEYSEKICITKCAYDIYEFGFNFNL